MTVEEAIKRLREQVAPRLPKRPEIIEAMAMAIEALEIWEKEKEPAPQEAETSSSKNSSIYNDNIKLKICQEVIDNQIKELLDYFNGQLSDDEQKTFNKGQRYSELLFVQKYLKEKINETDL